MKPLRHLLLLLALALGALSPARAMAVFDPSDPRVQDFIAWLDSETVWESEGTSNLKKRLEFSY